MFIFFKGNKHILIINRPTFVVYMNVHLFFIDKRFYNLLKTAKLSEIVKIKVLNKIPEP